MNDLTLLSPAELVDRIRVRADDLLDLVKVALRDRIWQPLGYPTWQALCDAEFGDLQVRIPRELRVEHARELANEGMSTRAIAGALGVGQQTIVRDLATDSNESVERPPVQSLDGRVRPATQPPRPVTKVETKETTYFDHGTGEVVSSDEFLAQQKPWQPAPPSREALDAQDAHKSRVVWTTTIARTATMLARLAPAKPRALEQMAGDYLPEAALSYGGVTQNTLRDAAAFLLALADVWEDKAA